MLNSRNTLKYSIKPPVGDGEGVGGRAPVNSVGKTEMESEFLELSNLKENFLELSNFKENFSELTKDAFSRLKFHKS